MGLDMMLFEEDKKDKIGGDSQKDVMYWRKANQIHNWFVKHVQNGVDDCETYPVSWPQLMTLHDTCVIVQENPDMAETLLPTSSGFFFGSEEYDEDYFDDLDNTIIGLQHILETTDFSKKRITYHASW